MTEVSNSTQLAAALAAGDAVIELRAGDYSAAVTIGRGVTIRLAAGVSREQAAITGAWTIDSTQDVTIDGLAFVDRTAPQIGAPASPRYALTIRGDIADHLIENSLFLRDVAVTDTLQANPQHYAIWMENVPAGGTVTIEGNQFTSSNHAAGPDGLYGFGKALWQKAIWTGSTSAPGAVIIAGNDFSYVRSAISANTPGGAVITENSFDHSGVAMSFAWTTATVADLAGNVFGPSVATELNLKASGAPTTVNIEVTVPDGARTVADPFLVETDGGADIVHASPQAEVIVAGAGVDTVVYRGTLATPSAISPTTVDYDSPGRPGWRIVTTDAASGTFDRLLGVEIVDVAGPGRLLLVGRSADAGFTSIQAAVDAAQAGDRILVAPGTYSENLVVDKAGVSIEGVGGDVTIKGGFQARNPAFASGDLSTWLGTATSYDGSAGAGVTIRANDVTLKNLNIDDFLKGVEFDTDVRRVSLVAIDISNSVFGLDKTATADVDGLTITGGSVVDAYQGTNFAKSTTSATDGRLSHVTIDGMRFQDITAKGVYAETLSDATLRNIAMENVAVFGRGDAFGDIGGFGAGIDINLKAGVYSSILIDGFQFHQVGLSTGAGSPHFDAGAITIKARNDGAYAATPASYSGAIVIRDGVIDGASTGVRVGEYTSAGAVAGTGIDLTVENLAITGEATGPGHGDFANGAGALITINYVGPRPSYTVAGGSARLTFNDLTPPPPEEPAAPVSPPTPPPPPRTPPPIQQASEGFGSATGVGLGSPKASNPTIVLPSGEEAPNRVYEQAREMSDLAQKFAAGQVTETQVIDKMVEFSTETTAVALQTYQFFTGAIPTAEGVAYLVNSDDNPTDLTDPYYAQFNAENRYINFAANLGVYGSNGAAFEGQYGHLTFEESIRAAYDKVIGLDLAQAGGVDVAAAIAYVAAQRAYFEALGGSDAGAKAAMVGYLMYAGMAFKVGRYYDGTRAFLADAFHGDAHYNVDLTGGASRAPLAADLT